MLIKKRKCILHVLKLSTAIFREGDKVIKSRTFPNIFSFPKSNNNTLSEEFDILPSQFNSTVHGNLW